MKYSSFSQGLPAGNPVANALVIFVGALAIGVSVVLGFLAFVFLASIVLVLGAVVGLRLWWLNRKLAKGASASRRTREAAQGGVIEGEYHVVKRDEKS
jgi:Tfp pilus assembly protein PilX